MAISKAAQTSQLVNEHESVTWHGAVGDGVTDDTAATQEAIDANAGSVIHYPYSASGYQINSVTPGTTTSIFYGQNQLQGTSTLQDLQGLLFDRGYIGGVPVVDELRGSRIEVVAGSIRQDGTTRTNWNWINDANHEPIGVDDSSPATASGATITINLAKTYSRVLATLCGPDETLANALNLTCGMSVGLSTLEIKAACSLTLSANIYYDGAAWQVDYGPGQGGTGAHNVNISSVVWDSGNGWLTITHDFCPGYDLSVVPYQRGGSAPSVLYIPSVYSTTKNAGGSYSTRVRFLDPSGAMAGYETVAATEMSFIFRKSYNEGLLLDGTNGTDILDFNQGNIWFLGLFEV